VESSPEEQIITSENEEEKDREDVISAYQAALHDRNSKF